MSNLNEKLRSILHSRRYQDHKKPFYDDVLANDVAQIKQAFKDAGWLTPEQRQQTQELVNRMAQTAQDMFKLPVTVREPDTMTSQEFYDRFDKEYAIISNETISYEKAKVAPSIAAELDYARDNVLAAAKRSAGLEIGTNSDMSEWKEPENCSNMDTCPTEAHGTCCQACDHDYPTTCCCHLCSEERGCEEAEND